MTQVQDAGSYVPDVPWEEYLQEIAYRYPYKFPPRIVKGKHPKAIRGGGALDRIPGGLPSPRMYRYIKRNVGLISSGKS